MKGMIKRKRNKGKVHNVERIVLFENARVTCLRDSVLGGEGSLNLFFLGTLYRFKSETYERYLPVTNESDAQIP